MWKSAARLEVLQQHPGQAGVMHEGGGAPLHQTKVFVEHSAGQYVTSAVDREMQAEEREKSKLLNALEAMHTWTTSREDARNYEPFFAQVAYLSKRFLDLLVGLCAGLSMFLILAVYSVSGNSDWEKFAVFHSYHYKVSQPLFLALSLLGVWLSLMPFAHESGMTKRRTFGSKGKGDGGSSSGKDGKRNMPTTEEEAQRQSSRFRGLNNLLESTGLQPLRRLGSIQLIAFVASLAATIATTSVEQGRTPEQIAVLSASLLQRIHVATIVRAVFHALAWIAAFFAPMPEFKPEVEAADDHNHDRH